MSSAARFVVSLTGGWILQDISSSRDLLILLTNLGTAVLAVLAADKAQHGRNQGYYAQYRDPNSYHQPQYRHGRSNVALRRKVTSFPNFGFIVRSYAQASELLRGSRPPSNTEPTGPSSTPHLAVIGISSGITPTGLATDPQQHIPASSGEQPQKPGSVAPRATAIFRPNDINIAVRTNIPSSGYPGTQPQFHSDFTPHKRSRYSPLRDVFATVVDETTMGL